MVLEGKYVFSDKKYPISDCSESNQMPKTDQKQLLLLTCAPIYGFPCKNGFKKY